MELLQLWQNIYREANELATAVERLPDECECGDAEAHLRGKCPCCGGHPGDHSTGRQDCVETIGRLQVDLTMLSQDVSLAAPALNATALESQRVELRRGVYLTASDVDAIMEAFRRLGEAVTGFRRECTIARMRSVKHRCVELREHCERVDEELRAADH